MLNKGIAFGVLPNLPGWIFVLVLLLLVFYAGKMRELWAKVGVWLIVIGGVGNLVNRAMFGGVVDNWDFFGLLYNNKWDYLIFFGLVIYGYTCYFRR